MTSSLFVDDDQERAFQAALAFVDDYYSSSSDPDALAHRNDTVEEEQEQGEAPACVDVIPPPSLFDGGDGAFAMGQHTPQQQCPRRHVRTAVAPAAKRAVVKRNGKILFKVKPNQARDGRREELIYLNKKVVELEAQLEDLKGNRALAKTTTATAAGTNSSLVTPFASHRRAAADDVEVTGVRVWQEFAERQRDERVRAERENIRLKLVLENQIKIAKSLEGVLTKKTSTKVRTAAAFLLRTERETLARVKLTLYRVDAKTARRKSRNVSKAGRFTACIHRQQTARMPRSLKTCWLVLRNRMPRWTLSSSQTDSVGRRMRIVMPKCGPLTTATACTLSFSRTKSCHSICTPRGRRCGTTSCRRKSEPHLASTTTKLRPRSACFVSPHSCRSR